MYKELSLLHRLAVEEDFRGTLGGVNTSTKKNTLKKQISSQKKNNVTTQPQQRNRNRVPRGN